MKTSVTDSGYCCMCDLLPGWTVSGSKDFSKFRAYVQESIDFYIDCAKKDGDKYPEVFDGKYEVTYDFDTCALLSYLQGTITFSGLQAITGINQKQLAHYAAGRSKPRPQQAHKIKKGLQSFAEKLRTVSAF